MLVNLTLVVSISVMPQLKSTQYIGWESIGARLQKECFRSLSACKIGKRGALFQMRTCD